jgi:predicted lactoylglutathione lyase
VDITPTPGQVNLVVRDIERSLFFYRLIGLPFGEPTGLHATLTFPNGMSIDLDQHEFARQWNSGTPPLHPGAAVFCLSVPHREDVDVLWQRAISAGYEGRQRPYDTFWGSRLAIIADPDGYQIGFMSPSLSAHRYWPPRDAPGQDTQPDNDAA